MPAGNGIQRELGMKRIRRPQAHSAVLDVESREREKHPAFIDRDFADRAGIAQISAEVEMSRSEPGEKWRAHPHCRTPAQFDREPPAVERFGRDGEIRRLPM